MIIITLLHFKGQDDLENIKKKIFTKEYLNKKLMFLRNRSQNSQ